MLLGHEAAGIVVDAGEDVTDLCVGQRVVAAFLPRCGACAACKTDGRLPCTVGSRANGEGALIAGGRRLHRDGESVAHHLGVSGFATYAVMDRCSVVPVGNDVPPDVAAVLGCAVLTGGGAVLNAGRPHAGQTVAVVGLGGVGMAALLVAASLDGVTVIGVDANPDKVAAAPAFGAHRALTPSQALAEHLVADVVVECAGVVPAFETAVKLTAPGGRTVTVGLPAPTAQARMSPLDLVSGAREIVGSYLGSAVPSRDIPYYETLWRTGKLPLEKLISTHIPLSEVNAGFDALARGEAIRQIIQFPGACA
jgi:alcohol dehydrogenase